MNGQPRLYPAKCLSEMQGELRTSALNRSWEDVASADRCVAQLVLKGRCSLWYPVLGDAFVLGEAGSRACGLWKEMKVTLFDEVVFVLQVLMVQKDSEGTTALSPWAAWAHATCHCGFWAPHCLLEGKPSVTVQ